MVGTTRRRLLILTGLSALCAPVSALAVDNPPPTKPEAASAKANSTEQFAMPGEDPPQAFVPLHPLTVGDRRQIELLRDYSLARALEDRHNWKDAITVLEEALKLDPDSVAILRRLSRLCFALSRTDKALEYARRSLQADPDDTETISRIVAHYTGRDSDRSRVETAVSVLQGLLANPKLEKHSAGRLIANFELGKLFWEHLRQPEKAATAFAEVLEALDEKFVNKLSSRDQAHILQNDPAETYLEFGRVFTKAKRDALAVKAFERGLVYRPDDTELPVQLAESLHRLGKNEEALGLVERFIKRQPQGGDVYDLLEKILTSMNRGDEITPRFEAAAKADSKNLMLQYALADRYRKTGQIEKAEALDKALLNSQPTPMGYSALAAVLLKRKKTDDLLKVLIQAFSKPSGFQAIQPQLKAIVEDRPYANELIDHGLKLLSAEPPTIDRSSGIRILGLICGTLAKSLEEAHESADVELEKLAKIFGLAVKLEPSPMFYLQLIDTQRRQGRFGEAASSVVKFFERYPDERNTRRLNVLGELRVLADQKDDAIAAFRDALKLDPNDVEAQYRLALVLSQTGKFDDAAAVARGGLKNDPANPLLNNVLGYVLTQSGNYDEAIKHYRGMLERFVGNEEMFKAAHSGLSVVYINRGDFAKGEAELEIVFQKLPDDAGVNNDLGYLYADQGKNLDKAETMIRKALEDRPEESAYLDSLGWVLFKRGKVQEAVVPLEKAIKNSQTGTDATIYEHLGDVYFQLKDYEKAKNAWEKAERVGGKVIPPEKRLPEIRKKLKSLDRLSSGPNLSAGKTP